MFPGGIEKGLVSPLTKVIGGNLILQNRAQVSQNSSPRAFVSIQYETLFNMWKICLLLNTMTSYPKALVTISKKENQIAIETTFFWFKADQWVKVANVLIWTSNIFKIGRCIFRFWKDMSVGVGMWMVSFQIVFYGRHKFHALYCCARWNRGKQMIKNQL